MIVVRIEVWPAGEGPRTLIEEIRICNVSGDGDTADYEVVAGSIRRIIHGFSRRDGSGLVWRTIGTLLGEPSAGPS